MEGSAYLEIECLCALEEFIKRMEQLPPAVEHPDTMKAMGYFCGLLHVARVELRLIGNPNVPANSVTEDKQIILFDMGSVDMDRVFTFSRVTGEGNRAEYRLYQETGRPDWNKYDREHLNIFATALFVYNGRARVMGIADFLMYHETDLEMHNLNYLMKQMSRLFADGRMQAYAGCRFDIHSLAVINKQLGRENGTRMMCRYVHGLEEIAGEEGILCRLGGDNFIFIFPQEYIAQVADYMKGIVMETGQETVPRVCMSANAGLAVIDESCRTRHAFMDRMMLAHELVKRESGGRIAIYDENMEKLEQSRRWVESHFEDAIKNREFQVYYQPKVELKGNTLSGAEALCRWRHEGEMIPPMRFIPVLEQSHRICALDFYMLERVCQDIRKWIDSGVPVVKVSVNISRVHLWNEDLTERLFAIVNRYQIPYQYIEFELTETTTEVDYVKLKQIVGALHKEGISTAVDDFGVGYSSLNLIRELPWNVLKIDKDFLPEESDENQEVKRTMLKHVIGMAKDIGLECIAEGTETREQVELVKSDNCYSVQGYFFDMPLPLEEFETRLLHPQYEW